MFRKQEGFTLVELMVVVLIIGILVAIAIPVFNSAKSNAQRKACFANQRTIEGALQTYAASNNGAFPAAVVKSAVAGSALIPTYIKVSPNCPVNTTPYTYDGTVAGNGTVDSTLAAENLAAAGEVHAHF
jgi:prepilin-type N-terminal cleavage/methylation domain-containing protein